MQNCFIKAYYKLLVFAVYLRIMVNYRDIYGLSQTV